MLPNCTDTEKIPMMETGYELLCFAFRLDRMDILSLIREL